MLIHCDTLADSKINFSHYRTASKAFSVISLQIPICKHAIAQGSVSPSYLAVRINYLT